MIDPLSDLFANFIYRIRSQLRSPADKKQPPGEAEQPPNTIETPADFKGCAQSMMLKRLGEHKNVSPISNLITAAVRLDSPAAAAEMDRMLAISKFFRSFTIVLVIFIYNLERDKHQDIFKACIFILVFSIWLYGYQRWKRKEFIYGHFIVMNARASE